METSPRALEGASLAGQVDGKGCRARGKESRERRRSWPRTPIGTARREISFVRIMNGNTERIFCRAAGVLEFSRQGEVEDFGEEMTEQESKFQADAPLPANQSRGHVRFRK